MTDKRDICERIEKHAVHKYHTPMVSLDASRLLLEAKAEIERLLAIVAEAHAKPYHYMTADGKTITAAELEVQRNAAWRALDARAHSGKCPECGEWLDDMCHDSGCSLSKVEDRARALVASEQTTQEPKP